MGAVRSGRWWLVSCGCGVVVMMFVIYTITVQTDVLEDHYHHQLRTTAQEQSENDYHLQPTLSIASSVSTMVESTQGINSSIVPAEYTTTILTTTTARRMSVSPSSHLTQSTSPLNSSYSLLSSHDYSLPPPSRAAKFTPLSRKDIKDVRTFVLFVGFARSGHSIVGTLMDAHPDIIIAHEYNVLKSIKKELRNDPLPLFNHLYRNSYNNAMAGWRSRKKSQKGYNLSMSGDTWQGRVHSLRVIGDKAAGMAAQEYATDHTKCTYLVAKMKGLGISARAIRVLRNPYDIIATRILYKSLGKRGILLAKNTSEVAKYKHPTTSEAEIRRFFGLVSHVNGMIAECHLPVLDVRLSDLVSQPRSVVREICAAMGVECSQDYFDSCAGKVFKTLSKTRSLVKWPPKHIDIVAQKISRYPEFSRYSYNSDC